MEIVDGSVSRPVCVWSLVIICRRTDPVLRQILLLSGGVAHSQNEKCGLRVYIALGLVQILRGKMYFAMSGPKVEPIQVKIKGRCSSCKLFF